MLSLLPSLSQRHHFPQRVIFGKRLGRPRHAEPKLSERGGKLQRVGIDENGRVADFEAENVVEELPCTRHDALPARTALVSATDRTCRAEPSFFSLPFLSPVSPLGGRTEAVSLAQSSLLASGTAGVSR